MRFTPAHRPRAKEPARRARFTHPRNAVLEEGLAVPEELELKLELSRRAADVLAASDLFGEARAKADQHAIYFDTPDQALFQSGLSLRIRRSGQQRVRTVKAENAKSAGFFARPEWERPVSSDRPVLDGRTPIAGLLKDRPDVIAPAFEVQAERRTWILDEEGARIELVIDRGAVRALERIIPLYEIELELKTGSPASLFALARGIDAIAPIRIGVLSKAERGYRLLGPAKSAHKAEPVALDLEMAAAEAFQAIARSCLRHYRLNEAILLERREAEALHQARVAIRRLRSGFSIFKAMLTDRQAARLRHGLRNLGVVLGEARNIDVLIRQAGTGSLHDRLSQARDAAYTEVEKALASDHTRAVMLDLVEWLAIGDWLQDPETQQLRDMPARSFAEEALDRFRRKVKKHGRDLENLPDEARHELRKDAKKLRYAAAFFVALFNGKPEQRRLAKFVDALEELQDQLGALNDLVTAPAVLGKYRLAAHPDAKALLGKGKKPRLLDAAAAAHGDLLDAKAFW
nr:CHAD domain-containing protein [Plastoroseomonas hellenica]